MGIFLHCEKRFLKLKSKYIFQPYKRFPRLFSKSYYSYCTKGLFVNNESQLREGLKQGIQVSERGNMGEGRGLIISQKVFFNLWMKVSKYVSKLLYKLFHSVIDQIISH